MQDLPDLLPDVIEYQLGAQVYKFAPLTMGDLAALGSHIRQQRIKDFRAACDGLDPVIVAAGLESIIKADPDINMTSPEAVTFLVWRSLLRSQPDLTLEAVGQLLSMANVGEVTALVNQIGGASKN
ncbi:MAG: hypothetical protein GX465_15090 [Acidobacteria bacterium]|nr:hypothetical protein [Acidobacteriota bacterium]